MLPDAHFRNIRMSAGTAVSRSSLCEFATEQHGPALMWCSLGKSRSCLALDAAKAHATIEIHAAAVWQPVGRHPDLAVATCLIPIPGPSTGPPVKISNIKPGSAPPLTTLVHSVVFFSPSSFGAGVALFAASLQSILLSCLCLVGCTALESSGLALITLECSENSTGTEKSVLTHELYLSLIGPEPPL